MFNVLVGGYFSLKRNIMSVPLGVALTEDQLIPFTLATLRVFRCGRACGAVVLKGCNQTPRAVSAMGGLIGYKLLTV